MKKRLYIKTAFFSLAAISILSSCLKDSRYIDYSKVGTLVELPLAEIGDQADFGGPLQTLSYSLGSSSTDTLTVAVNVASPKPLSTPLKVTLSTTDVSVMNADAPGSTILPASDYTVLGGLTVTVPANQRLAYLKIIINAAAIGVANSGAYSLPVTIENASGEPIAQPDKGLVYNIVVTE